MMVYKGLLIMSMTLSPVMGDFIINGTGAAIFFVDNTWKRLKNGVATNVATQTPTQESVKKEGTSFVELAQESPSIFAGKTIKVAISCENKVVFEINNVSKKMVTEKEITSPVYNFGCGVTSVTISKRGDSTVLLSGYRNGSWGGYSSPDMFKGVYSKVRAKAILRGDSGLSAVTINGVTEGSVVGSQEIITKPINSDRVSLILPTAAELYVSGVKMTEKQVSFKGSSAEQKHIIAENDADFSSMRVYNENGDVSFDYNTESREISFTSEKDCVAVYMVGAKNEEWKRVYSHSYGSGKYVANGTTLKAVLYSDKLSELKIAKAGTYYMPNLSVISSPDVTYKNGILKTTKDDVTIRYTDAKARMMRGYVLRQT